MKMRGQYLAVAVLLCPMQALADVTVCVSVSATGPAAALGIPEQNTVAFLPKSVDGTAVRYVVYDDATDPTAATRNARKCVDDDRADVILGSSSVPTAIAVANVAAEAKTPVIALSPVTVKPAVEKWTFRSVQQNALMAGALVEHMKANKVKTLGFIGYADAYGEDWLIAIGKQLADAGIAMPAIERFARTDTSVTGQVLKLVAAKPDAVLVVGSGTPAALPAAALAGRGYAGAVYQTHGAATRDFIRVGGKAVEGSILPVGPVVVAAQLPDDHPSKAAGLKYVAAYEAAHGTGSISAFGGMMFDAGQLAAAGIKTALAAGGKPGTAEFREGVRNALENLENVVSVNGVYNTTPGDHYGHDRRSRVLVTVSNGDFKYVPSP